MVFSPPNTIIGSEIMYLNLGGGPNFHGDHWYNLDAVVGSPDGKPFRFSETCELPFESSSLLTVYSSHTFEHLDDKTISRVLQESRRILMPNGVLVLKIPDFTTTIKCCLAEDSSFFTDDMWNFGFVTPYWHRLGVEINIINKALMVLSSFTTPEFGDPFGKPTPEREGAYFGPPHLSQTQIKSLFRTSPGYIARQLRTFVLRTYPGAELIHQNAWNELELEAMLNLHGFDTLSFEKDRICAELSYIPDISSMFRQSIYCVATVGRNIPNP